MSLVNIAVVQEPTAVLDLQEGVRRAVSHIERAASQGAQVIVFPESWLTGYPAWVFGMAGWNDAEARHWYSKFVSECPTHDGPELEPIRKVSRDRNVVVALGFNERIRENSGSVFNSILLIGTDGSTLNLHRKLTPTHTEKIVWAQGDASGLRVSSTEFGNIGGLVCWEHWHPLARQALHAQDEQIHMACWPDMPDSHALATLHYAFEGRCFVAAAAHILTVDDVPSELLEAYRIGIGPDCSDATVLLSGGSGIAGPDGRWIGGQLFDKAGLVCAEIDLAATTEYKHDLDVVGHYSREDIFQLSVDRRAKKPVRWIENESSDEPQA